VQDREKRIARLLERLALLRADNVEGWTAYSPQPAHIAPPGQVLAAGDAGFDVPSLDAQTVLLEYHFGHRGNTVFCLTDGGLSALALEATQDAVQRALNRWHLNLDAAARAVAAGAPLDGLARNARGILESLYRLLIEPVARVLAGKTRLVVVPFGATHAVPFHALYDGRAYLLERMEVSVCPSTSLLRLCAARRRRDRRRALVLAHTDAGRVPHVLREAEAVAALLPGACFVEAAATRAALSAAAPRYGVIHLAAHGEARLDSPVFAYVKLADGQLTTADVFNLALDGALVTLSACESGRTVVQGGDELVGLSRGFLFAGASALVQSLWRVEDGSTAWLMEQFYAGLRDGLPAGAALRAAQLAALARYGTHPFWWAPFQLVGDAGAIQDVEGRVS
jgi:CHAT domain-containing protein